MKSAEVVEWAPFRVKSTVTEAQLLEASRALQESFLSRQRGFLRRDLLRGANGQWIDIVYWSSRQAVDEAMASVAQSPACQAYFQLMAGLEHEAPAGGVTFFERAASYG
jgi:hypothetical protein